MSPFHHILVPVDFGTVAQPAVDLALSVARTSDAKVTLLHVFDESPFLSASPFAPALDVEPILAALEKDMSALREKTKTAWPKTDGLVVTGNVYDQILDAAAKRSCDLIVIGTHGRRGIPRALLGSVAERVVRLSPVPVLTVRPTPAQAAVAA